MTGINHDRFGKRGVTSIIVGAHALTHIYNRSFYVIIPVIYQQLGLVPFQAGLMDAVRWIAGGLSSMVGGFFVDIYRYRRGLFLGVSLMLLGVGYFLAGLIPSYGFILLALALAHVGSDTWHPAAIGLLSEGYPDRRGLLIAIHRSAGSVGETVGPILVGFLLLVITWQQTLQAGLPLAVILGVLLSVLLWNVGGDKGQAFSLRKRLVEQVSSFRKAARVPGLLNVVVISVVRGIGDQALFLFIPMYLAQNLEMDVAGIGFHMGLLALPGIASGPIVGFISDRIGHKPLIVMVMLISAALSPLILMSGTGISLTISIILFGLFLHSVNSLVQAAAMDLTEGTNLKGTFIGMLYGTNSLFGAISAIVAGALASVFGFQVAFYYAAVAFLVGGLLALRLPQH